MPGVLPHADLVEEAAEAVVVGLRPVLQRMGVAAGAEHPHAAEDLRHPLDRVVRVLADREVDAGRIVAARRRGPSSMRRANSSSGMFAATAPRMNSRNRKTDCGLSVVARVLQQIAPLERPVIDELRAARTARRSVFVALLRIGVGEERPDLVRLRLHADQVEIDAAQELLVAGDGRRRDLQAVELLDDVLVDQVIAAAPASARSRCRASSTMTPVAANVRSKRATMAVSPASPAVTSPSSSTSANWSLLAVKIAQPRDVARRAVAVVGDELQAMLLARLAGRACRAPAGRRRRAPDRRDRPARPARSSATRISFARLSCRTARPLRAASRRAAWRPAGWLPATVR